MEKVIASKEIIDNLESIKLIKQRIKELESTKEAYETMVKAYMSNYGSEILTNSQGLELVTWKNEYRTSLDTKRLKKELPDIWEKYASTSLVNKFLIK